MTTESFSPGDQMPINFVNVYDAAVLGGVVPEGEGDLVDARVFLCITTRDEEGNEVKVNYCFTPWEAIRLGIAMGDVSIQTVEVVKAADSDASAAAAPQRKRHTSPYL